MFDPRKLQDPEMHTRSRGLFRQSWQLLDPHLVEEGPELRPFVMLPGLLNEPLVRTPWALLPNVCTHRGSTLIELPCQQRSLRCPYHGRRFSLAGRCEAAPGFEQVEGFPSKRDHLSEIAVEEWGPLRFASVDPMTSFEDIRAELDPWIGELVERPGQVLLREEEHHISANWALYIENYLEGLHLPFVHPDLSRSLSLPQYSYETLKCGTLQVGAASADQACLDLPEGHPLGGQRIRALYVWLWPNTMINVYPWGLSMNRVEPRSADEMVVRYHTWVLDHISSRQDVSAVAQTEAEDQQIVRRVQAGMRSSLVGPGTLHPEHEVGVKVFRERLGAALRETK
ncbi:MAG: choline monooxygenase [Cognaticolwellia sp.]|jgi:choline monooxygenase